MTGVDGFDPDPFSTQQKALRSLLFQRGEIELLNGVFTTGSLLGAWIIKSFERNGPFCASGSINLQLNWSIPQLFKKALLNVQLW